MPAQDRTGPSGQGPLTGRGLGPCGQGASRGFGRGFRRRSFWSKEEITLNKTEQKKILEAELKDIEEEKKQIQKKLKGL